jgi:hypothetical protein
LFAVMINLLDTYWIVLTHFWFLYLIVVAEPSGWLTRAFWVSSRSAMSCWQAGAGPPGGTPKPPPGTPSCWAPAAKGTATSVAISGKTR